MRKLIFMLALSLALVFTAGQALADTVYMRSNVGAPWGQNTNEQAMDQVFGAGNWDDLRYETGNVAAIFSGANEFVFMEGGDSNANELEAFLTANQATIEAWVQGGGSLFLNSAPNEGDGMSFGFGGVALTYDDFSSNPVSAVNAAHPIFNGPYAPINTTFSGNFFAHASVSGGGVTDLINDGSGSVFLAEKDWGLGHVMFGGMTTTNWHQDATEAFNLRKNILAYGAALANPVPEPASIALMGFGLLGAAVARRRRKVASA